MKVRVYFVQGFALSLIFCKIYKLLDSNMSSPFGVAAVCPFCIETFAEGSPLILILCENFAPQGLSL